MSPLAFVADTGTVGPGSIMYPGAVVSSDASVGKHCVVYYQSIVHHHSTVGDGCCIAAAVSIAGMTHIGKGYYLGIGSKVKDRVRIGDGALVGDGFGGDRRRGPAPKGRRRSGEGDRREIVKKKLSLVIPAFNEEDTIPFLEERLTPMIAGMGPNAGLEAGGIDFEIIIVDDHSRDKTPDLVKAWTRKDARVHLVRLSRNSGSHAASSAGIAACTGDAVTFMAADLQNPPELIPDLIKKWEEGFDVVWAVRMDRPGETFSAKLFSNVYHGMMHKLGLHDLPGAGTDSLLMTRKVIDAYLLIPEKNTSLVGMVMWMGYKQTFVPYVKPGRVSGQSKWTLAKKLKLFVDTIVSFSFAPIRAMTLSGALFAFAGLSYAAVVVVGRLMGWIVAGTGFAALMTVMLVGFGLIMLMLGVMGEYLWRTFDEARGRPRFLVEESYPPKTAELQPTTSPSSKGHNAAPREHRADLGTNAS